MKKYSNLEFCVKNPHFSYISGSRLYGMDTLESDIDIRAWTIPPFEYLIGVKNFECAELEGDNKVYSLKRFLQLALKGDSIVTEGLFVPENKIVNITELGKSILNLKNDIVSNAIFWRIMGYSIGEWRKAMAIKIVPKRWKKEKHEVINNIRNLWHPDKQTMDRIIENLEDIDEVKVVSSQAGLGTKRKKDVEQYGFCRKSAAHSIRLVKQITELMRTGVMTFPRPDAQILLDIRYGKYTKEELEEIHDDVVVEAKMCRERSVLPDKPNEKKIWKVYKEMVKNIIKDDVFHLETNCNSYF